MLSGFELYPRWVPLTTVFVTLSCRGFLFISKYASATTARENVVSSGKDPETCLFISRVYRDSYKDSHFGNEKRRNN